MFIVYKHVNKVNGKIYVGQTKYSMEYRLKHHVYASKRGNKYNHVRPFHAALVKYGTEGFTSEVIESGLDKITASEREIYWIDKLDSFNNGYNATKGGDYFLGYNPPKGKDHHSYKTEVFTFFHKEHETFIGTQNDFAEEYNLKTSTISKLTSKVSTLKRVKGWAICAEDLIVPTHYRLLPDGTPRPKKLCGVCNAVEIERRSNTCRKCIPRKAINDNISKKVKHIKLCPNCKEVGIEKKTKTCRKCVPKDLPNSAIICPVCTTVKIRRKNKSCRRCRDDSGKNNPMYGKSQSQKTKDAVSKRMRGSADKTLRTWIHESGIVEDSITCLGLRDKYPELLISKLNAIARKLLNKKGYLMGKTHKGWKIHE